MRISLFIFSILTLVSCGEKNPKKASTDLVNIAATADSSKAQEQTGKAIITFEKLQHDFGNITQGEVVEYAFIFTNTGTADLLIANAIASCGCTVPEWPKDVIKPGAQGRIKVKFNSELRLDKFLKEVTITANTQPIENVISITGVIKAKPSTTLPNSH